MVLPKLSLVDSLETGLQLSWEGSESGSGWTVEYKEAMNPSWDDCKCVSVDASSGKSVELFELEPGRPYMIRVKAGAELGEVAVYDTLPMGCTPKKKKKKKTCTIL